MESVHQFLTTETQSLGSEVVHRHARTSPHLRLHQSGTVFSPNQNDARLGERVSAGGPFAARIARQVPLYKQK